MDEDQVNVIYYYKNVFDFLVDQDDHRINCR